MSPRSPTSATSTTRERILDAADRLFGELGFERTSMRALTREAGVNLAAVHYHFGSKLELLRGALARHLEPVNAERLLRLDKLEAAGTEALSVEAVLDAMFRPTFEFAHASPENARAVRRVISLLHREPESLVQPLMRELFAGVQARFLAALGALLPALSRDRLELRFQLAIGAMIHLLADPAGRPMPLGDRARLRELITCVAAALRAPLPAASRPPKECSP